MKPKLMAVGAFLLVLGLDFLNWGWVQAANPLNFVNGCGLPCMIAEAIWFMGMIVSPVGAAVFAYGLGSKVDDKSTTAP